MSGAGDTPETTIVIVRTFAAPVAEVFEAWTDPALMQQWLAPWGCKVIEAVADVRPGGSWRVVVKPAIGGRTVTVGEYVEIVPNQRIVKTWVLKGRTPAAADYPTLLTVEFRALGPDSTELTLRQDRLLTRIDRAGNRGGWRQCFNKLDALLAG